MASTASTFDPSVAPTSGARRTLLFRVGNAVYGCDIDDIREIVPYRQATRLPGAPAYVAGLINLRGTIVTVLDLGARLDANRERVTDGSIMLVALPGNTRLVGIAVQEVMDVRVVGTSRDDVIADSAGSDAVRGLAQVDGGTVILLDIHSLVRQVLLS
ncbi:MAG: chemotaxis protein CheW [Gemmatimonadaceae bacterium]